MIRKTRVVWYIEFIVHYWESNIMWNDSSITTFPRIFFWYDNNKTLKMCIFCYPSTTTLGVIETVKNSKAYFQSSIQFLLIWNKHFEEKLDQIIVFAVHWYLVMMETYHFSTMNLNCNQVIDFGYVKRVQSNFSKYYL